MIYFRVICLIFDALQTFRLQCPPYLLSLSVQIFNPLGTVFEHNTQDNATI